MQICEDLISFYDPAQIRYYTYDRSVKYFLNLPINLPFSSTSCIVLSCN